MKKIIVALIAVLMLTACASKNSEKLTVANGNDAVITKNGKAVFTEADYVDALQYADNSSIYTIRALAQIAENEGLNVDEEVANQINSIKEMLGDYYEDYIKANAGSVEFYELSVKASIAADMLKANYVSDNAETLANDNNPRLIQVASFETEDTANEALARIKAGEQFDVVAFEIAGEQDTIKPYVITENDSTLEQEVKEAALKDAGLSEVITVNHVTTLASGESSTTSTYYLVNVISTDYTSFIDDFKDAATALVEDDTLFGFYFHKHNFEVNNVRAYKNFANNYPSVLG